MIGGFYGFVMVLFDWFGGVSLGGLVGRLYIRWVVWLVGCIFAGWFGWLVVFVVWWCLGRMVWFVYLFGEQVGEPCGCVIA